MKALLVLEDGSFFEGISFGASGECFGEVVFNTSMTGYQEILTDPSYCGQIVVMTYPLIGNYGINDDDFEAEKSFMRGFVVKENCEFPSNWRSKKTISQYLKGQGIVGISGVDTREITRIIRNYGAMRGVISTVEEDREKLLEKVQKAPSLTGQNLVSEVSTKEVYTVAGDGKRIVLIDFGAKKNIIRCLNKRGFEVVVVPHDIKADDIMSLNPGGIMMSNGPGDPVDVPKSIETVRKLIDRLPIFGICLGHQVIVLALGGKTYKLKFGHRGANQPVKDLKTGRVYITSQNHGFAVEKESLPSDTFVSHINLNDGTVEGIRHKELPVFSVQYHPEAAPGPQDSEYLFDEFANIVNSF